MDNNNDINDINDNKAYNNQLDKDKQQRQQMITATNQMTMNKDDEQDKGHGQQLTTKINNDDKL